MLLETEIFLRGVIAVLASTKRIPKRDHAHIASNMRRFQGYLPNTPDAGGLTDMA